MYQVSHFSDVIINIPLSIYTILATSSNLIASNSETYCHFDDNQVVLTDMWLPFQQKGKQLQLIMHARQYQIKYSLQKKIIGKKSALDIFNITKKSISLKEKQES